MLLSFAVTLRTLGNQLHDEVSKQVKAFVETQTKARKAVCSFPLNHRFTVTFKIDILSSWEA